MHRIEYIPLTLMQADTCISQYTTVNVTDSSHSHKYIHASSYLFPKKGTGKN